MNTVAGQLLRTAALCGALGILLYLVLAIAGEYPVTAPIVGFAGASVVGVLVFHLLRDALRSGIIPERSGITSREASPVWYWGSMLWYGACLLALTALALMCLLRIVGL
jgi:hypothetical protein